MHDLVNKWYEAVEQEHDNTSKVFDCILHYTSEKATDTTRHSNQGREANTETLKVTQPIKD